MKKLTILLLFFTLIPGLFAQNDSEIFTSTDEPAEFPGGQMALMQWLSQVIRYPEAAYQNDVQGRVIVKFIVEVDGEITNPTILRGVDKDLDAEALRVIKLMPRWIPAKINGQPVRSYFNLPCTFKLRNNNEVKQ